MIRERDIFHAYSNFHYIDRFTESSFLTQKSFPNYNTDNTTKQFIFIFYIPFFQIRDAQYITQIITL